MAKIISISSKNFKLEEDYTFHKQVAGLAEKLGVKTLKSLVDAHKAAFNTLGDAIDQQAGATSAQAARQADAERDVAWRGANAYFKALAEYDPDNASKQNAALVLSLFEKYGNPTSLSYSEETGVIDNLLQSVRALDAAALESCGGERWITQLEKKQAAYEAAARTRTSEAASRQVGMVKTARTNADNAYAALAEMVNALVLVQGEAAFGDFIANVNVLIEKQKQVAKTRNKVARGANEVQ